MRKEMGGGGDGRVMVVGRAGFRLFFSVTKLCLLSFAMRKRMWPKKGRRAG